MDNIFLKPAPLAAGGVVLVRDPSTQSPLAMSGEWKALSQYWTRRLRDGDVVEAQPNAEAPTVVAPSSTFARCTSCLEPVACKLAARCAHNSAPRRSVGSAGTGMSALEESAEISRLFRT
ncbi:DUF2635 domain-containing protein [Bradyrhizobium sp. HKCCYLRH1065]|uniref:DUF2635 domain-containing protein n=1 Tax=unclassified Bradyrhizobium TaxID=2631580 RepID=UPI003EC06CB0